MLKNHVNGCHGNHAVFFFMVQIRLLFLKIKILCISGVPINDLAPMKNCPRGARLVKLAPGVK